MSDQKTNMFKVVLIFLSLLLHGCLDELTKHENPEVRYFSDATDCFHSTDRKIDLNIKSNSREGLTLMAPTNVQIPLSGDARAFQQCMQYKGHPSNIGKVSADGYLNVSRACLDEARDSATPNEAYAACVQRNEITVEPIRPK